MPAKNHIDLVVKTLKVLESLAESENGKALKEIAQEVGLVKSSVFRILFTLKAEGYVEQPETNGVYRLTLKTAGLTRRNMKRLGLMAVARPYLTRMRNELDESVALAERRLHAVVLIDVLESMHPLRLSFHIGNDCPVHATALGKSVAAFLPAAELAELHKNQKLVRYTAHTKTKLRNFQEELKRVRHVGYALNDEETVTGAFLAGAPLFDAQGVVCGAISVNTPTARTSPARKKQLISAAVETAKRISTDLKNVGYVHEIAAEGAAIS
jgi:DNA-binding IclR family transcriptional regulator